jgi:ABC-type Fe3+/spermidine/putrescine transport system ATPase subunit
MSALTMSDRIAVMKDGKIAQLGTPREIYERPNDLFVARFIGESSLLEGKITAVSDAGCTLDVAGQSLQAMAQPGLKAGDAAKLVLRPEHVAIGVADTGPDWNRAPAKVTDVSYQGPRSASRWRFWDRPSSAKWQTAMAPLISAKAKKSPLAGMAPMAGC